MSLRFFSWLAAAPLDVVRPNAPPLIVESYPPLAFSHRRAWSSRLGGWLGASGWRVSGLEVPRSFGRRARGEALAAARLDFADALIDVRTPGAATALDRIAVARSLHELWHFRAEVFSRVSRRHDQAEAARRLAELDRHFPKRSRSAAFRIGATMLVDSATRR